MYDLIGDIHGYADELVQLLEVLGYEKAQGVYRHPERKVIFLGDFIDRGPKIRQVLEIVRPMIEEGKALAVMGNHELNDLAYHTEDPDLPGNFLRQHSDKNVGQHRQTVEQLKPADAHGRRTGIERHTGAAAGPRGIPRVRPVAGPSSDVRGMGRPRRRRP